MRKKWVLFCITLVISLSACTYTTTADVDYGMWDKNVSEILTKEFHSTLPDVSTMSEYEGTYYYKAEQALLGDLNFVITCQLQFADYDKFLHQTNDLTQAFQVPIHKDGVDYYLIRYSDQHAQEFMDEKVYDGMFYYFEIIIADHNAYSIEVINAKVWDYYGDAVLEDQLCRVIEKTRNGPVS